MSVIITEREKAFLAILLRIGYTIIEGQDGYAYINDEPFSSNSLYELAEKLGFDDFNPYM